MSNNINIFEIDHNRINNISKLSQEEEEIAVEYDR